MRSFCTGILCLVLASTVGLQSCSKGSGAASSSAGSGKGGNKGKRGDGGPVPVTVTKVSRRDVPLEIRVVGDVEAYSTVTVKAQVAGQLTAVYFQEGDYVKKGDKLFTIDPRQLEAQLAQAEATMARDAALLRQSEATLLRDTASQQYALGEADRYAQLVSASVISIEQGAQSRANADALSQSVQADKAAIESARAQIAADRANIDNIKVQLSYTTITSPIDGRTGSVLVKQGNVVNANTSDLVTINQVTPILVTFGAPEGRLPDIKKYMAQGTLPVTAQPQDNNGGIERGQLTFVDNAVDATTGAIRLKGTFGNADLRLWPGQFVNVIVLLTTRSKVLVVPSQVVQTNQDGQFLYVLKEDQTVELRPVSVGPRVDQDMVIEQGLKPGDTVIVDGQLRLAHGSRVQVREAWAGEAGAR